MKKYISIIMTIIVMLTAGVNTELLTVSGKTPITVSASAKAKSSSHKNKKKKKKKHKHKHYMPKGNMGKWFKSKKALRKHVDKVMKYWADKEESGEITWEEYTEKCPCGYEAWSCPCGKWTGNFKYN